MELVIKLKKAQTMKMQKVKLKKCIIFILWKNLISKLLTLVEEKDTLECDHTMGGNTLTP